MIPNAEKGKGLGTYIMAFETHSKNILHTK
jgi:hypothetical protein